MIWESFIGHLFKATVTAAIFESSTVAVQAATCGNTSSGFNSWKAAFASEAKRAGVGQRGLQALASSQYASKTIAAEHNQNSFKYSPDKFMKVRGAPTIVSQGRKRKAKNASFFQALVRQYGVPAGVIIAIHGMETGFWRFMGDSRIVSAITTLAHDCRRSAFFVPHAIGALKLVDKGAIDGNTKSAKHGELGHTQFLPGNALKYGIDADRDGRVNFYT